MPKYFRGSFFRVQKIVCLIPLLAFLSGGLRAQKVVNFNFSGVVYNEITNKTLEGVKVELVKNKQVIQSYVTESRGKYSMVLEINQKDSNDANYTVSFSKEGMVPKSAKINTFIQKVYASAYNFSLEVYMTPRTEGDVIIDLPSAKIKWDIKASKFSIDQSYANIIKEIKKEGDSKKAQELIAQQKMLEDAQKRKEEQDRKAKEEASRKAAEEAMRKSAEAVRKQQEELERLAALQKAREDSAALAIADALRKTASALKDQVKEIKKQEIATTTPASTTTPIAAVPVAVPLPKPVKPEVVSEDEDEFMIKEIYSIRDVKALRSKGYTLSRELQKRKIKNWSTKYETENPLTSLLDEIDLYEKNAKKLNKK